MNGHLHVSTKSLEYVDYQHYDDGDDFDGDFDGGNGEMRTEFLRNCQSSEISPLFLDPPSHLSDLELLPLESVVLKDGRSYLWALSTRHCVSAMEQKVLWVFEQDSKHNCPEFVGYLFDNI